MCVLGWCGGAGPDHGQFYAGKDFWDPVNKRRLFNAWAMVQETDFCAILYMLKTGLKIVHLPRQARDKLNMQTFDPKEASFAGLTQQHNEHVPKRAVAL